MLNESELKTAKDCGGITDNCFNNEKKDNACTRHIENWKEKNYDLSKMAVSFVKGTKTLDDFEFWHHNMMHKHNYKRKYFTSLDENFQ